MLCPYLVAGMLKGRLEGHLCRFGTGDRPRPDAGLPGTTACASWPWVAGCVAGVKPVCVRSASESSNCVRASPCCELASGVGGTGECAALSCLTNAAGRAVFATCCIAAGPVC